MSQATNLSIEMAATGFFPMTYPQLTGDMTYFTATKLCSMSPSLICILMTTVSNTIISGVETMDRSLSETIGTIVTAIIGTTSMKRMKNGDTMVKEKDTKSSKFQFAGA